MTRAELMVVLSRLEAVRLRGLYFSETQRLSLSGVGLEEASDAGSGRRAHTVEMCACPPDYTGDSCQVGKPPVHASAPGTRGRCTHTGLGGAVAPVLPGPLSGIKWKEIPASQNPQES